jgi:hypothetical protein
MKQYLKDSVNILGMSMDELMDGFVAPSKQDQSISVKDPNAKLWEQQLNLYLDKLNASEDVSEIIDQVCTLSLKLLNEINAASK